MKRNLFLVIFCYLAVYIIWGSTYLFIAYSVETIPAAWVMAVRFLLSGIVFTLLPVVLGKIKKFPSIKEILSSVFLGIFLILLSNGVITWAEKTVDSYLAALIVSTAPLTVALFNRVIHKTKLSFVQIIGILTGFAGVTLLLYNGKGISGSLSAGVILVIFAAFCWGFGTSFATKLTFHENVFMMSGIEMIFGGFVALIVALFTEGNPVPVFMNASPISLLSVLYLTIVGGSGVAAYSYLLRNEPSQRITTHALVNPVIATILGLLIRKETKNPYLFIGLPLILTGLFVMLYLPSRKKKYPAAVAAPAAGKPFGDTDKN